MVVVYLKNGEKAPLPDATDVKLEAFADTRGLILRCFFGAQEVGQFKWEDVAGYSIAANSVNDPPSQDAFETWNQRNAS